MFKKYAKGVLDKEITSSLDSPAFSALHGPSFESSPLSKSPEILLDPSFEEPETVIGENVNMKGTLSFQRLLRVDGTFDGEIQSQGKIIVGPTGSVKAHLNLEEAFISGKVEGNITVKNRLVLRGRAQIRGDITAASITIDEGVTIEGFLRVGKIEVPQTSYGSSSSSSTYY